MPQNKILDHLDKPEFLEAEYHRQPNQFTNELQQALAIKPESETLNVWQARLNYRPPAIVRKFSLFLLIALCLMTFFVVKIPSFFPVDGGWFASRFFLMITITAIMVYFLNVKWSSQIAKWVLSAVVICAVFVAQLPDNAGSASVTMSLLHVPLLMLSLLAICFMSDQWRSVTARLEFIRYLGEMLIYTVLILLGGAILTAVTIRLFQLIGFAMDNWYFENIVVLGLVSAPLVATYLLDCNEENQSKFAVSLAKIFSPLFLITLVIYLLAVFLGGLNPRTDRDFLIVFNGVLLIILAITLFSIAGKKSTEGVGLSDFVNVALLAVTLIISAIALFSIVFRWAEHGMTINRMVVFGCNSVIFVHLALLFKQYVTYLVQHKDHKKLEATLVNYFPVYTGWSLFVVFCVPLLFGFV